MAASTNKQNVDFYFESIGNNYYKCKCGNVRKIMKIFGYQNFRTHINAAHKNYLEGMKNPGIESYFTDENPKNIFSWLEWDILSVLPFSFVNDELTRKYSNLEKICRQTFVKYVQELTRKFEEKVSAELLNRFVLVIDGWTDAPTSNHYLAVFASYPDR